MNLNLKKYEKNDQISLTLVHRPQAIVECQPDSVLCHGWTLALL